MGLLTVSLDNDTESYIRHLAKEKYQGKKGSLARVIQDLAKGSKRDEQRRNAFKSFKARMEKGYDMGKLLYKHRSELYDRI